MSVATGADLVSKIAYAVGYDVSDLVSKAYIEDLIDAGIEDMKGAGVPEAMIVPTNKLVVATLTIFVNDNLNLTTGAHKTSVMYISNIDKLRSMTPEPYPISQVINALNYNDDPITNTPDDALNWNDEPVSGTPYSALDWL